MWSECLHYAELPEPARDKTATESFLLVKWTDEQAGDLYGETDAAERVSSGH